MTTTRVTYTLDVPGRLSTVNATRRRHWSTEAAITQLWRQDAYFVAKADKIPRLTRVRITCTPQQARGRLADAGAHAIVVKAVVDGICDSGVISDDSPDVVLSLTMAAPERADARNEGMRIVIEEVRDA